VSTSNSSDVFEQLPILEEVGAELERILKADSPPARRQRPVRRGRARWRHLRPLVLVFVLVAGGTAAALAATGVILPGSPVRPSGPVVATAGVGIPVVGGSRLLGLRVGDPAGGLPWGMRIVHTTRSEVCVQVGRVDHGQLGQLGIDGAFGNDGRFHPLPPDVLPTAVQGGDGSSFETCAPPGDTSSDFSVGLEASAASTPPAGEGVAAGRRVLSFGLLGPHATSITYRSGSQTHTEPVLAGLGAYLIVQKYTRGTSRHIAALAGTRCGYCFGPGGSNGDDLPYPQTDPASPSGALISIAYRLGGKTCIDNAEAGSSPAAINQYNDRISRFRAACGLTEGPPPRPTPLQNVHAPLRVQLQIHNQVITGAEISFAAPLAVTKAGQSYLAWVVVGRKRGALTGTRVNITRGETVSIPVERLLAQTATRSVTIEIEYDQPIAGPPGNQLATVGTVTIHEPAGTHPAPLPHHPEPVPPTGKQRLKLLGLRVHDPAGGSPWGIQLALSHGPRGTQVAIQLGRISNGRIGFLGQDNAFHDDGRFHPANDPAALMNPAEYAIAGSVQKPALQTTNTFDVVLPAVASAYQGCSNTTASEFAACPRQDLRTLIAGFVEPTATTVTINGDGIRESEHLDAGDNGFYLFVLDKPWNGRLRFTATLTCANGQTATGPATPSEGTGTAYCPAP
jgi:hypothetical protein